MTTNANKNDMQALLSWACETFPEGCYLGDTARLPMDDISEDEELCLRCAREGFLVRGGFLALK